MAPRFTAPGLARKRPAEPTPTPPPPPLSITLITALAGQVVVLPFDPASASTPHSPLPLPYRDRGVGSGE